MVYADDAEKFGEWPGTHEWVFEKGWLRGFFERLRDDEGQQGPADPTLIREDRRIVDARTQ